MTAPLPAKSVLISEHLAVKLSRLLDLYALAGTYTRRERHGGVMAGCPRGAPVTPERLAFSVRLIRDEFHREVKPQWEKTAPCTQTLARTFKNNELPRFDPNGLNGIDASPKEGSEESLEGLSIQETRLLAALSAVKPPKNSSDVNAQYARVLIERVWVEYQRLKHAELTGDGEPCATCGYAHPVDDPECPDSDGVLYTARHGNTL